jgi:glycerol-3-phosphate dehydrogenase (NAD(P)+)|tara:strand:+ start:36 stop:1019 length:984 start_codon:yes stop_codon:yes gene_type:complete
MKVAVLGGGVWGSALTRLLSKNEVILYARDKKIVKSINEHRLNPKLKYVVFNKNVTATDDIDQLNDADYIFIALPAQSVRGVVSLIKSSNNNQEFIIASKGIEIHSLMLLSDVVKEITKNNKISVLSGPCFSDEVAQNLPTALTFSSNEKSSFDKINTLFNNINFRIYYSKDVNGCQIGGALKNVYAIASGITMGLNLGENAKSALITRSFVEIQRFAKHFKASQETIFGLSGLGDLMLTCNSLKSRNTKFGQLIAGIPLPNFSDIIKSQQITEGYFTVKAVKKIADKKKINMPIMNSIYNILYNNYPIKEEINKLLARPFSDENKI